MVGKMARFIGREFNYFFSCDVYVLSSTGWKDQNALRIV